MVESKMFRAQVTIRHFDEGIGVWFQEFPKVDTRIILLPNGKVEVVDVKKNRFFYRMTSQGMTPNSAVRTVSYIRAHRQQS